MPRPISSHPLLQKESFDSSGQQLTLIVHMTPRDVLDSEEYCRWMASFGPQTRHLLLHETLCPPDWTLRGFLDVHAPLNLMDPSIFKKLPDTSSLSVESTDTLKVLEYLPRECVITGEPLLQYSPQAISQGRVWTAVSLFSHIQLTGSS